MKSEQEIRTALKAIEYEVRANPEFASDLELMTLLGTLRWVLKPGS